MALGLACVDPKLYPQSAKHIKEAQALGYSRIVTRDSVPLSKVNARRSASTKVCRQTPVPYMQCDEYPHSMFLENAGKAHVKKISAQDNQQSGAKVGNYAQAHNQLGQLEVVVPNAALFCKNAF